MIVEKVVFLSIVAKRESEPVDLLEGIKEIRLQILSGEHSMSGGQGKGGGEGG